MLPPDSPPKRVCTPARSGDAAFLVLSDPHLFHLVQAWATDWSARLSAKWRAITPDIRAKHPFFGARRLRSPKARLAELFMRELMMCGDLATLKLASKARWRDRDTGVIGAFPVQELQFAVRGGHAETVRWTITHTSGMITSPQRIQWYWNEAITRFEGSDCGVFEVLADLAPPVSETMYANLCRRFVSLAVTKWVVDKCGVECVPSDLVVRAAKLGNVDLVEYLWTIADQELESVLREVETCNEDVRVFVRNQSESQAYPCTMKTISIHDHND